VKVPRTDGTYVASVRIWKCSRHEDIAGTNAVLVREPGAEPRVVARVPEHGHQRFTERVSTTEHGVHER
jgi:hypothetical protein